MGNIVLCPIEEHSRLSEADVKGLESIIQRRAADPQDFMGVPEYLGMYWDNGELWSSYYVGATWLKPDELAAVVKPKIKGLDFLRMFAEALKVRSANEGDYFSLCYGIDFEQPEIEVDSSVNILTPLLIVHFLSLVGRILHRGLKKGYVQVEKNLHLKVKGRILVSRNIKVNSLRKRDDHAYCSYQEYTEDIIENRLLKKALCFSRAAIAMMYSDNPQMKEITARIDSYLQFFRGVSDDVQLYEMRTASINKLYADYSLALRVAKQLLRRYGYSISNISASRSVKTPPFWIDMPRLFELYTFGQLSSNFPGSILFQVKGYGSSAVDFLKTDEHVIIDVKYKPAYRYGGKDLLSDIREISGYSRDCRILKKLYGTGYDISSVMPDCVILYPDPEGIIDPARPLAEQYRNNPIDGFTRFYKLGIALPVISGNSTDSYATEWEQL